MLEVYALLDRKLREFSPRLLVVPNLDMLQRDIQDGVPGSGTALEKHPDDFDVYLLGTFDVDTGMLVPEVTPRLVLNLSSVLVSLQPPVEGIGRA